MYKCVEIKQHATDRSKKKSRAKFKNTFRQMTMETQQTKTYEMQQNSFKTEVYSDKRLHQEKGKFSNKQPNFVPWETRRKKTLSLKLVKEMIK